MIDCRRHHKSGSEEQSVRSPATFCETYVPWLDLIWDGICTLIVQTLRPLAVPVHSQQYTRARERAISCTTAPLDDFIMMSFNPLFPLTRCFVWVISLARGLGLLYLSYSVLFYSLSQPTLLAFPPTIGFLTSNKRRIWEGAVIMLLSCGQLGSGLVAEHASTSPHSIKFQIKHCAFG